jgi:nucleotide-binding universal stress UspA family protein
MTEALPKFEHALIATDFSEPAKAALETAAWVGRRFGARLTVVHVVQDVLDSAAIVGYGSGWAPAVDALMRLQTQSRHDAEEHLLTLTEPYGKLGVALETEVLTGTPYAEILRAAEKYGADLVITGTRGLSTFKRALIGSTATKLTRLCPCPVWVSRAESPAGFASILVPIDFSPASEKALATAASLASAAGVELHLLHVYDTGDLHGMLPLSEENKAELAQYRRRARRAALERLRRSSQSLSDNHGITANIHVSQGTPWRVIGATAKRLKVDLIVVGSVGRIGIPGLLLGNTAENILHTSECSLLVVKPGSFMSPALRLASNATCHGPLEAATTLAAH